MTKEQQDLAWACLPKEVREQIRQYYMNCSCGSEMEDMFETVFGEHNVSSLTEPEEMLMVERKDIQWRYALNDNILANDHENKTALSIEALLYNLFGDKCLPDKEEQNIPKLSSSFQIGKNEQPEPKFKVGDKVRAIDNIRAIYPNPMTIKGVTLAEDGKYRYNVVECGVRFHEDNLEPYTEENKEPKYHVGQKVWVEEKIGEPLEITAYKGNGKYAICPIPCDIEEEWIIPFEEENKETMKEKELSLCELLKGCVGKEVYSLLEGVTFIRNVGNALITTTENNNYTEIGSIYAGGVCLLYPSKELYEKYSLDAYSAWMEWKEARKPKRWRAKSSAGVAVSECEGHWEDYSYWYITSDGVISQDEETNCKADNLRYELGNYFRTKEEAQQAAEVIRKVLQEFHESHAAD